MGQSTWELLLHSVGPLFWGAVTGTIPLTLLSFAVGLAIALPFTPLASLLGFTPLPLEFFGLLALLVVVYLAVVQWAKRAFYRHRDACHAAQADSQ